MIVLGANVLIGHLDAHDNQHDRARTLLAGTGGDPLGVNALTMAEVLVAPIQHGWGEQARGDLAALGVTAIALGAGEAGQLATLRAETGLKMPDSCVLLTAEVQRARLATFDDRLARVATSRGLDLVPEQPTV